MDWKTHFLLLLFSSQWNSELSQANMQMISFMVHHAISTQYKPWLRITLQSCSKQGRIYYHYKGTEWSKLKKNIRQKSFCGQNLSTLLEVSMQPSTFLVATAWDWDSALYVWACVSNFSRLFKATARPPNDHHCSRPHLLKSSPAQTLCLPLAHSHAQTCTNTHTWMRCKKAILQHF